MDHERSRFPRNKIILLLGIFWLLLVAKASMANPREIDKVRRYYRDHNLDFFGDLIANQVDFNEDEKRHAKLELLADDARTHALEQLDHLLSNAKGDMRAELLIRKATLLADRARTATYFQNNPFKASKLKSPKIYLEQSTATFIQVEKGFPNHGRMDVVLFSIAYNFGELKNQESSLQYYNKTVQKFGASPLVGDARLAIAEIYFDRRRFGESLNQLREIVKSEHPRLKNFALYKMAWTYYNMADLDSAIVSLEKVIEGVNSANGVQRARLELRKEALHDLVAFYAERPDSMAAANAQSYFERIGHTPDAVQKEIDAARAKRLAGYAEKKVPIPTEDDPAFLVSEPQELMFRLAQVYRDQGKHEPAMIVAEQLIEKLSRHPKVVALYRLRAESAEKLRRRDLVITELERLAKIMIRDLEEVSEYKKGLPESKIASMSEYFSNLKLELKTHADPVVKLVTLPKATEQSESYKKLLAQIGFETLKDFSTFMHGEWMKTQGVETAKRALAVYDLAINALMNPWRGQPLEACFELRYKRAQLRFALKQWDLAAEDFHWITRHMTAVNAETLKDEIAALESWLKEAPVTIKPGKMGSVHERLVDAYDSYLAFQINNPKVRDNSAGILAASARLYKEYGQTEEALHRMIFYSLHYPKEKDAVALTRDVLALLERTSRWEELRDFSQALLDQGNYKTTVAASELTHSNEYASLRLLETLEKDKNWKKASKEFASFAEKNPSSSFVSQALIKSANAALEMKDIELTVERLEKATLAPDDQVRLQAWLALEPFYRKAYQWQKLLSLYDAVLKIKPIDSVKENRAAIMALNKAKFSEAGETLITADKDLGALLLLEQKYEKTALNREYRELRFMKSNNNPANNFKKKADMHTRLTASLDELLSAAPKSMAGAANVWVSIEKAALLIELADTFEKSALPSALNGASEVDRKSYTDTLAGQTKELREKAQGFVTEAAKLATKVDSPFEIEGRVNKYLETFAEKTRLSRAPFAEIWAKRPMMHFKQHEYSDKKVAKLGLEILTNEKADDIRKAQYELAKEYWTSGETGYAYAIAGALLNNSSDEWASKAARLQFEIDAARLPAHIRSGLASSTLGASERWDLARWIAGQAVTAKKLSSEEFSKDEQNWFSEAPKSLLRAAGSDVAIVLTSK